MNMFQSESFFSRDTEFDRSVRDLCDYYGVTRDDAITLGTRSSGRRPNLPGSSTTQPVAGKTLEEIWDSKSRSTPAEVFEFYRDQGAWSSFRQVVRHKGMDAFHTSVVDNVVRRAGVMCEYGCGVAPFTYSKLMTLDRDQASTFFISDVDSEHFNFGIWRCRRLIEERGLERVSLVPVTIEHDRLPVYPCNIDGVVVFEVLEHVPSPVATLDNLNRQLMSKGVLFENFIKHVDDDGDGPDLRSARLERDAYYEQLYREFSLLSPNPPETHPNESRFWQKR